MLRRFGKLALICTLVVLSASSSALAQQTFANWTSNTTFDIGPTSATVSTANPVNAVDSLLMTTLAADGAANYPDMWFTPTPPVGIPWSSGGVDNVAVGSTASVDVTVTFSAQLVDPRFHFVNLDNGTVDFSAATVTFLSGNPEFEVTGMTVNSTPNPASATGCEDAMGGNPNGGCGTVELSGVYTSVTFTVTDTNTATGNGDGFQWTVSADPSVLPPPAIPTASQWGLGLLALLLTVLAIWKVRQG